MSLAPSTSQQRRAWKFLEPFGMSAAPQPATKDAGAFVVYKDAAGRDRWASISSTAYQDRDGEIVSTKALRGAVAMADATGERGPLRFWHVPGLDIGDCDYQAVTDDGRFLLESGTFRKSAYAAALKAAPRPYHVSIGFTHPASEPAGGVFEHIAIFERSIVPDGRASNLFTRFATKERIMPLPPEKLKELEALFSPQGAAALLSQVEQTDKAAQAAGVAFKEAPAGLPVYDVGGVPHVIVGGALVALKAFETKAPMAPGEMLQAAATEAADAVARAEGEAEMAEPVTDDAEIVDLTVGQLKAIIADAFEQQAGGYSSKMAELKAQYDAMGKAFGAMQAQKDSTAAEMAAVKSAAVAAAKLATALEQRVKELEGDAAPATKAARTPEPQSVVPVQPALKAAGADGLPAFPVGPNEHAYHLIHGEWPSAPIQ